MKNSHVQFPGYLFLTAFFVLVCAPSASSQSINGRFYTSFYSWEREVFGQDPAKHFQTYTGAIVHIRELGHKDLSFHTYVRFSKDISSQNFTLRNKLYNAYLEWKNLAGDRLDLSFGRQFIWAGVGYGTIDGGKAELNMWKWGKIGIYAGTQVPLYESWNIDSWSESHMVGTYYKNRIFDTDVLISWARKNRKPVSYISPGEYTDRIISTSSLEGHLAGIDLSRSFTDKLTLFVRTEGTIQSESSHAFEHGFNLDRIEVSADYKPHKKLMITGQYRYREPRENLNSIFSIFSSADNREFWVNLYYYPYSRVTVYGGWAVVRYDNDDANRYNSGVTTKYFSVNLNTYSGYSGDSDNFTGSAQYPLLDVLWIKGSLSVGRYKMFEDTADYNNLIGSSLGFTFNPKQSFTIDLEGQGLRNGVSSRDMRILGRINYWFFSRK